MLALVFLNLSLFRRSSRQTYKVPLLVSCAWVTLRAETLAIESTAAIRSVPAATRILRETFMKGLRPGISLPLLEVFLNLLCRFLINL